MSSLHGVNRASKCIVTTAACAALAISAAGCGEKEEPGTTGPVVTQSTTTTTPTPVPKPPKDSSSPPLVVDAFLSSPNVANVCENLITPEFLRKEYGGLAACARSRKPGTLAKGDSRIVLVDNKGRPLARATAMPKSGRYQGKRLQLTLLRQGAAWRINSLVAK